MFYKFRKNPNFLELLQNRHRVPGWCPAVGETRFPSIGFGSESNADTMLSPMLTRLVKISCPPLNLDLAIHNLCNFLVGLSGSWILRAPINDQGYTGVATESSLEVFTHPRRRILIWSHLH